jgi:plastocyanin
MILALSAFASNVFAKEVFLSIAGTVSNFHTDARIFNPSSTKDIVVKAYLLPAGVGNNNSGVASVDITVPKRSMKVLDDVVTAVFSATGIGGIRLTCDDDFVATSRIFAATATGTLGQFVQGLDLTTAIKNGLLIQMKSSGTFRTNIGALNPNNATATVTWRLYDKNNALIGTPKVETFAPYGVLGPTNVTGYFSGIGSADLSDAWVGFTSDQPIFAYVSVLDNSTTDPTYIPASPDSNPPSNTTNNPLVKVFNVVEQSGLIAITPDPNAAGLQVGDTVEFHITSLDFTHGFEVFNPSSQVVVPDTHIAPGQPAIVKTFTVTKQGTYVYLCTITTCSAGHTAMNGSIVVGDPSDGGPNPGY